MCKTLKNGELKKKKRSTSDSYYEGSRRSKLYISDKYLVNTLLKQKMYSRDAMYPRIHSHLIPTFRLGGAPGYNHVGAPAAPPAAGGYTIPGQMPSYQGYSM